MKKILFSNQKGGVGKTSSVVHCGYYFAEIGKRTLIIDADVQGNTSFSLENFASSINASDLFTDNISEQPTKNVDLSKLPEKMSNKSIKKYIDNLTLIQANDLLVDVEQIDLNTAIFNFQKNLEFLSNYFDICFIDIGAAVGVKWAAIMSSINFLISPIECEKYSILGIEKTILTLSHFKNVEFLGILPCRVDFKKPRQKNNYKTLMDGIPEMITPMKIHSRDSIAEACDEQIPVWSVNKSAARHASKEIKSLCKYITEKTGI
ncbi:MAG: ParA family protein [Gilliamella sp.]|nr:ParA family protein [Gilliamella sp.]